MADENSNRKQQNQGDAERSRPVGNYNIGGQKGESVQDGGQHPADEPGGPFLGKSTNSSPGSANPGKTGTPDGNGKHNAPQKR
jgi:hypothetical protein